MSEREERGNGGGGGGKGTKKKRYGFNSVLRGSFELM